MSGELPKPRLGDLAGLPALLQRGRLGESVELTLSEFY